GKKICGILIEQRNSGDTEHPIAVVAGIGLNVTQPATEFRDAGLTLAGSIASQTGQLFSADQVSLTLIQALDEHYERMVQGDLKILEDRWQQGLALLGRRVRVEGLQRDHAGWLRRLTLDMVRIETEREIVHLRPEEIRHIADGG